MRMNAWVWLGDDEGKDYQKTVPPVVAPFLPKALIHFSRCIFIFFFGFFLAFLTFVFCLWILLGLGQETVFWGFFLTMCSVPIYVFAVLKRDKIK